MSHRNFFQPREKAVAITGNLARRNFSNL